MTNYWPAHTARFPSEREQRRDDETLLLTAAIAVGLGVDAAVELAAASLDGSQVEQFAYPRTERPPTHNAYGGKLRGKP